MGLLTAKEAAKELRTSVKTVWLLVADGELVAVQGGRGKKKPRVLIDQRDLDAFIERRKRRQTCEFSRATTKTAVGRTRRTSGTKAKSSVVSLRDHAISERRKKLLKGIARR